MLYTFPHGNVYSIDLQFPSQLSSLSPKKGANKHGVCDLCVCVCVCVCVCAYMCVLQRMHREREEMINQMPLYFQDENGNQVSI
jgi:hypothetical protein